MKKMEILYLGDCHSYSTSRHRSNALRRLGHNVTEVDPRTPIPDNRWVSSFNVRTGYRICAPFCGRYILKMIENKKFDLCWIDQGPELPLSVYRYLRSVGTKIVNYNLDDPFGRRDGRKWDLYRKSVHLQDVTVVVRDENIAEAKQWGARMPIRVFRSYDPLEHDPARISTADMAGLQSDVLFLGTWMPERGPFLSKLVKLGVPLTIRGGAWERAGEPEIRECWKGGAVYNREYVATVKSAKICLGLLSKGNRDLHTQRSSEIPYIGTAFCCENTADHRAMFTHNESALLWDSPEGCKDCCLHLLNNHARLAEVAARGRKRIIELELSNDEVFASILRSFSQN